jgi:hypothetical protein
MGDGRGVYRLLVGRPKEKRPIGMHRRRWEDNIKMNVRRWGSMVRTGSSWFRLESSGELL